MNKASRKVLYVSSIPPPAGGVSTWTRILLRRGLPSGWRTGLIDKSIAPAEKTQATGLLSATSLRRMLRALRVMLRELRRDRPALVHINVNPLGFGPYGDFLCAILARSFGIPVVAHYHGLISLLHGDERRSLVRLLTRIIRMAARNVVINLPSGEYVRQLDGRDGRSVVLLPNFYDETELQGRRPEERPADAPRRVVFIGGMTRDKGFPQVLGIARALPKVSFHVIGARYPEAEDELRDLPENVTLHGEVDHDSVLHELAASHLFLLPTAHEGFPYAVLEAMVHGLPVVSTQVGAIPEMIEDGRGGRLVEVREVHNLVRAVEDVLSDEPRRVRMATFNQDKARRDYAFSAVSGRLVSLYSEIT